jgi:UDP:flavonoid glycosyltransferase YjiC (YdhE family)
LQIVLAAEGTRGDVHPMLALGVRLAAEGHAVRVCASPDFEPDARACGLAFQGVGGSVRDYLTRQAEALHAGPLALARESWRYARESLVAQFRGLAEAAVGADVVVGAGVQLGAPSVAERLGVPYRYVAYCPAIFPSGAHAPFTLEWQPGSARANRLAWRLTLALMRRWPGRAVDRERRRLGLAPVADIGRYVLSERPILAVDRELAEVPADAPVPVDQVPCLHPFEAEALPAKLEAFLEAGPPPVYLGFGSMTDPRPHETTRALLEAVAALGVRAVIARGWAGLGDGPLPGDVFVTGPVAHAALFPRTAAVVHHGGAGTTATAARAGAPQVLMPHVLDQYYWARRVERLGLGPPAVRRRDFTPARLAQAIGEAVSNEVLAERARELGERLRRRAAERVAWGELLAARPSPVSGGTAAASCARA